jgi:hypothetical protein
MPTVDHCQQVSTTLKNATDENTLCWAACGGVQKCALTREQCVDPYYNKEYTEVCREVATEAIQCNTTERKDKTCTKGTATLCSKWMFKCCTRKTKPAAQQVCAVKFQSCCQEGNSAWTILKAFFKGQFGFAWCLEACKIKEELMRVQVKCA